MAGKLFYSTKTLNNRGDVNIVRYVIYHCYGGSHSSVTAAAVHGGLLPRHKAPTKEQLLNLPFFDTQGSADHGYLQYIGQSGAGVKVYSVGFETASVPVIRGAKSLFALAGAPLDSVLYVDTRTVINSWMVVGGVLSRKFGLTLVGRPLVAWGTRLAFGKIVALVAATEHRITEQEETAK